MVKYRYIVQIKCTEAVLSNSTWKLLWFETTKMLIAVLKSKRTISDRQDVDVFMCSVLCIWIYITNCIFIFSKCFYLAAFKRHYMPFVSP